MTVQSLIGCTALIPRLLVDPGRQPGSLLGAVRSPYLTAHHLGQVWVDRRRLTQAAQEESRVVAATASLHERCEPDAPIVQRPDVRRAVEVLTEAQELARVAVDLGAPGCQARRRRESAGRLGRSR